jgi:lipid II:glycine glycyltransferase (peptidoglycan interpeptide bridge formation enzyme)
MENLNIDDYRVESLGEDEYPKWDNFVKATPQYSYFSNSSWIKILSEAMRRKFQIIGCYNKNRELVGGCILYLDKRLEGTVAKLPPLTPYNTLHLLEGKSKYNFKNERYQHTIILALNRYFEKNYDCVMIVNHPNIFDIRPFIWKGWEVIVRYTYYKNIDTRSNSFISSDISRRAEIALKGGIKVKSSKEPSQFYRLWQKTFKRQRIDTPLEYEQFLYITNRLISAGHIKIYTASDNNNIPLASCIGIYDEDTFYYWLAAFDANRVSTGANQLLIKELINSLIGHYKKIDLVGADIPSIAFYKSTFGGKLIPHYQVSKAMRFRAKIFRQLRQCYKTLRGY